MTNREMLNRLIRHSINTQLTGMEMLNNDNLVRFSRENPDFGIHLSINQKLCEYKRMAGRPFTDTTKDVIAWLNEPAPDNIMEDVILGKGMKRDD